MTHHDNDDNITTTFLQTTPLFLNNLHITKSERKAIETTSHRCLQSQHHHKPRTTTTQRNMANNLSRKDLLAKVYKMVPPMLEKFHKGMQNAQERPS
jgi:hypothetical protein